MATLQKIRSKGPLLLIIIGLALLAFILGDAWKIIRPNQGVQFVGTIDGKEISAMDFQHEVENYTEVIKFAQQTNDLTEEQMSAIRDEVWATMVRNQIINKEAQAIGLTVTDAEVKEVINRGTDPVLANTPFGNAEGKFDADILKSFIAFYTTIDAESVSPDEYAYYESMYRYWLFVEKEIKSGVLYSKYSSLVKASILSNPIAAKNSFDNRIIRADVLMASLPYSSISDADAKVGSSELKKAYAENKETFYNYSENRDIYYIDYLIQPSDADRKALREEVNALTNQLEELEEGFDAFVRRAESEIAYSEVPRSVAHLPYDVVARLDSVNAAGVFGPYYLAEEDSYNTFRLLNSVNGYDSIQVSMIQVVAANDEESAQRADSIMNAAKKGASFDVLAEKYGQTATPSWLAASSYELAVLNGDNAAYINKLNSMKKGEVAVVKVTGANLVLKVIDTKNPVKKYDVAIVKRPVIFSPETSNDAYNKLSLFMAQNATLDELQKNAEDSDFRLLYYPSFENYSYNVGGVARSHEALRWAFAAQEGEVSNIFEVGNNNDHLLVVAVSKIHERGYSNAEDVAQSISLKALKNQKFNLLSSKMAGLSFDELKSVENIKIDTVKFVNFTNSAYISSISSNEPVLGPSVATLDAGVLTNPMQGENCVFVAQKISPNEVNAQYEEDTEKLRLITIASTQIPGSIIEALYFAAQVVDERYKLF